MLLNAPTAVKNRLFGQLCIVIETLKIVLKALQQKRFMSCVHLLYVIPSKGNTTFTNEFDAELENVFFCSVLIHNFYQKCLSQMYIFLYLEKFLSWKVLRLHFLCKKIIMLCI